MDTNLRPYRSIYTGTWTKTLAVPGAENVDFGKPGWQENTDAVNALMVFAGVVDMENMNTYKAYRAEYDKFVEVFKKMETWSEMSGNGRSRKMKTTPRADKLIDLQPSYPTMWLEEVKRWITSYKRAKEGYAAKAAEAARLKKAEHDGHYLGIKAAVFLCARGFTLKGETWFDKDGKDFGSGTVSTANEVRYQELVNEKIASGGFHDYNGCNCDGPCEGWDGASRRCECGNNRVSWTYDGNFEDMHVYGETF